MGRGKNKEHICECGTNILHRKGFNATGIQEIADAAQVPKGSFYNYFKSKDDFGVEALNMYIDSACEFMDQALVNSPLSPLNRLKAMYQLWIDGVGETNINNGCLLGNLAQELSSQSPKIRTAVDKAFKRTKLYYTDCIRQAQELGEINDDQEPDVLAEFITNAWQGAILRAKASCSNEPLKAFQQLVFQKVLIPK